MFKKRPDDLYILSDKQDGLIQAFKSGKKNPSFLSLNGSDLPQPLAHEKELTSLGLTAEKLREGFVWIIDKF